ncbi:PAB-dependent poly(A)-specific ribonuclease subunit pan3 [Leucoagaricus sp. SymC.cos]|nr:PAB-dependent poly(A)-specific ribonuclease subunit pan3 [Leucoagaricus sp. SymC.cos]
MTQALTGESPFIAHYRLQQLLVAFMRGQATPPQPKSNSELTIVNGGPLVAFAEGCWDYDPSQRPTAAEALQILIKLNVTDERPSMGEELALFEAAKGGREEVNIDYGHILSLVHKWSYIVQLASAIRMEEAMLATDRLEAERFHQVDEHGNLVENTMHVLTCLNKLDAGSEERVMFVSRDDTSCSVISCKEIKACMEGAFR